MSGIEVEAVFLRYTQSDPGPIPPSWPYPEPGQDQDNDDDTTGHS